MFRLFSSYIRLPSPGKPAELKKLLKFIMIYFRD